MSDKNFLDLCKTLIAERYLLGGQDGHWRQRDFEALSEIIYDKSGISISLSTLKRLWKSDFNQTPHPTTLDALVSLLDCGSWLEFKNTHKNTLVNATGSRWKNSKAVLILSVIALTLVGFLVISPEMIKSANSKLESPSADGSIIFSSNKTVSVGVPNTVIFKYDVSNIRADSFFLQQSWNEDHRVTLDPSANNYSSTYYTPGFHRAKLVADDSVFKTTRIHIKTDGWLPLVKYNRGDLIPVYLRDSDITKASLLTVNTEQLQAAGVDLTRNFILNYHNVREFADLNSGNFRLSTRVKCDSLGNYACPQISVTVVCEEGISYVPLTTKGCVGNLGIKFGEMVRDSRNSDLSAFGTDIFQWQRLQISVEKKLAQVSLNDQLIFEGGFSEDYGKIMGLVISFTGPGSVDSTEVYNLIGDRIYPEDLSL